MSKDSEIARMIRLAAASRVRLSEDYAAAKRFIDVPTRVKTSVKSHPTGWLGGSLLAGLGANWLFRNRRPSPEKPKIPKTYRKEKSRGVVWTLLGVLFTAGQPLLKAWIANRTRDYFLQRLQRPASPRY